MKFYSKRMVTLESPPKSLPAKVNDVKAILREDTNAVNGAIEVAIEVVTKQIEDAYGIAIINQQRGLILDGLGTIPYLKLPCGPLVSVDAVYLDGKKSTAALEALSTDLKENCIGLAPGKDWPQPKADYAGVRIVWTCGYGETPDELPGELRRIIAERAALYYEYGEEIPQAELDKTINALSAYAINV